VSQFLFSFFVFDWPSWVPLIRKCHHSSEVLLSPTGGRPAFQPCYSFSGGCFLGFSSRAGTSCACQQLRLKTCDDALRLLDWLLFIAATKVWSFPNEIPCLLPSMDQTKLGKLPLSFLCTSSFSRFHDFVPASRKRDPRSFQIFFFRRPAFVQYCVFRLIQSFFLLGPTLARLNES